MSKGKKIAAAVIITIIAIAVPAILISISGSDDSPPRARGAQNAKPDQETQANSITNTPRARVEVKECGESRGLVVSEKTGNPPHNEITEGCSRRDWVHKTKPDSSRQQCIRSFEKSQDGKYHNCEWIGEPRTGSEIVSEEDLGTCAAETEECIPEMAGSTDKPYCSMGIWQPWHYLGGTDPPGSISQYCYCRDDDIGVNHKSGDSSVSSCLPEDKHSSNFGGLFNSGKAP